MSIEIKKYNSWEHAFKKLEKADFPSAIQLQHKQFRKDADRYCFQIHHADSDHYGIQLDYYIGVDWLIENHSCIVVAPKLDTRLEEIMEEEKQDVDIEIDEDFQNKQDEGSFKSVDYFAMLQQCLDTDFLFNEIDNLVQIDWHAKEIPIAQTQDWLSPLLIVKYLNVLKSIVRKGLKKSYYPVTQNLQGKVKGKILVGANIKQNVFKNQLTRTVCTYEEFGVDHTENRLLHKAFQFACSYLDNYTKLFGKNNAHVTELVNFCRPAFTLVGDEVSTADMKHYKPNPFFKEYTEGIHLAKLILKRYAYAISNTAKEKITTPPYWIDMPKLFELYAYHFLKKRFHRKGELTYHFTTYGNELDFLVNTSDTKLVVDAKYKPVYIYGKNHYDMRQLSGYARLEKVRERLGLDKDDDSLIDCLVIYPDVDNGFNEETFITSNLTGQAISGYRKIFKIGIKLPLDRND